MEFRRSDFDKWIERVKMSWQKVYIHWVNDAQRLKEILFPLNLGLIPVLNFLGTWMPGSVPKLPLAPS